MGLLGTLKATSAYNSYRETINGVYYKIVSVLIDTEKAKVRIAVRGWLSEYARHNQGIGIFKRVFYTPLETFLTGAGDGINFVDFTIAANDNVVDVLMQKGYDFIKTLPEFSDTIDSLEEYIGNIDITEEMVEEQEETLSDLINSLKN